MTSRTDADSSRHILIIGGGSAAFSAALRASDLGANATIVNAGLPAGGTCVNVGCVPSKTLLRAAMELHSARHSRFSGIATDGRLTSFSDVTRQKQSLVEELRKKKYLDLISGDERIRLVHGRGKLVAPATAMVNGERIQADGVIVATGASTHIPPVEGLSGANYLTNETAFDLKRLPESLIVLGGRFVALEIAQMFSRLGSQVTLLQRSERILPSESEQVTEALAGYLREEGVRIICGVSLDEVRRTTKGVIIKAAVAGVPTEFDASEVLVATGRAPNTHDIGLEHVGVELDQRGFVKVDDELKTTAENVYAAGDVIGEPMFVYTAAYEGALAAENVLSGSPKQRDYTALPWVVFTDPQVGGVGLDERQAREAGHDAESFSLPLSEVPRAVAGRDTRGFVTLIRERNSKKILGARILAPEGGELLMEVAIAVKHGLTSTELVNLFHPYLTLSEALKLAAIGFDKQIHKLSCCAT